MSKKRLRMWVLTTLLLFALLVGLGLGWYLTKQTEHYNTFKELLPILVAIPLSWLGYCFQRRLSYLTALRNLWQDLLPAIQQAIQFTHLEKPNQKDFALVMQQLSIVIDGLRGVFKNITPKDGVGLYPYEPLKEILRTLSWLDFGDNNTAHNRYWSRRCIKTTWASMHQALLMAFDTEVPQFPLSKYLDQSTSLTDHLIAGKLDESTIQAEEQAQRQRLKQWRS